MKKRICLLLVFCMLLSALVLPGCSDEEIQEELMEGVEAEIFYQNNPFDEVMQQEWTPVFTSYLGNEKLEISRNHDSGFLGIHCTQFLIALYEGEECKYYSVASQLPCKGLRWFFWCNGTMATFESARDLSETIDEIYPYLQDVFGYLTIHRIQNGTMTFDDLKVILGNKVFGEVLSHENETMMAELDGSAMGTIIDANEFVSKMYELYGSVDEACESYRSTGDLSSAAAYYVPAMPAVEEGFKTAALPVALEHLQINAYLDQIINGGNGQGWQTYDPKADFKKDLNSIELSLEGDKIRWRNKGTSEWQDLDLFHRITKDSVEVELKVTESGIQWRHLTDTEVILAIAQKALHEKVKEVTYPVR